MEQIEKVLAGSRLRGRPTVVGVRSGGSTRLWARGELPDGESSLFEIGSVTKVVTALLLADLVRSGPARYDDPVADLLPVAPSIVGRPISLVDLATHHSGLPRLPAGMLLAGMTRDRGNPYARLDDDRMMQAIRETRPTRPPGERFAYSNYGAGLLGYALARSAGTSYDELVAARVAGPLGLLDTAVSTPVGAADRLAAGRSRWGRRTERWDLASLAGAGGLVSTATDLLGLLALWGPDARGPLAEAAAETAVARHRANPVMGVGLAWLRIAGGAGPARFRFDHDVLWHNGGTGGHRSFAAVLPETGDAVVVLSARARSVDDLGLRLVRALS
ncbi:MULTISPECIES: serine hydrolase domain-containing protein [unclassified Nocardioides]|uniref:serine hydrolase domain-containing protein n=1 Tax=unclassified Nocardioides TaxID=2615069 RepID=UPI0030146888